MRKIRLAIAGLICLTAQGARSQAFERADELHAGWRRASELALALAETAPSPFMDPQDWLKLAPPDPQTLAWLKSRIPGLDAAAVRAVPFERVDAVMQKAVNSKLSFLEMAAHESFQRNEIYYVSRETLEKFDKKYAAGTIPITGATQAGAPFGMKAFVAGQGQFSFIFDLQDQFDFKDNNQVFRVKRGGRVSCRISAPADVAMEGLAAHAFLKTYTDILRMVKESAGAMRIYASLGDRPVPIIPMRLR